MPHDVVMEMVKGQKYNNNKKKKSAHFINIIFET